MSLSKEQLNRVSVDQVQKQVASLLAPYVIDLLTAPTGSSYDSYSTHSPNRIKTLFLHETRNLAPNIDIFKLDLLITQGRIRQSLAELTVLERTDASTGYLSTSVIFTLNPKGSLEFKSMKSEGKKDPTSLLGDLKAGLEALGTVPYGKI